LDSQLLELAETQDVIVLMATHNLEQAARFSRSLSLRDGRLEPLGHLVARRG
jgi:ABC-type lipoprotein export system ATPase subunit